MINKFDKYTCFNCCYGNCCYGKCYCCYGNDKWRQIDRLVERFTLIDPVNEKQWRKNCLQTKVSLQHCNISQRNVILSVKKLNTDCYKQVHIHFIHNQRVSENWIRWLIACSLFYFSSRFKLRSIIRYQNAGKVVLDFKNIIFFIYSSR